MLSYRLVPLLVAASVGGCTAGDEAPAASPRSALHLVNDRAVSPPGERYAGATFSPDGLRLALSRAGMDGVDVVDLAGGPARPLVRAERSGYKLAWAPDGKSIVYRDGKAGLGLAWLAGGVEKVVAAGEPVGFPAVLASGEVLYARGGSLRVASGPALVAHRGLVTVAAAAAPRVAGWDGEEIFALDVATGARKVLFRGAGFFDVALSRDGRRALVRESRGRDGHLWIADVDGDRRQDLGVGWLGALSPDGRWLVYVLQDNDGERFLAADLWLVDQAGGSRVRLTDTADRLEVEPTVAPDGRTLAYLDAATGEIRVARLEGALP